MDEEGFEAPLVDGADALGVGVGAIAMRVRDRQSAEEFRQVAVALRPKNQAPWLGIKVYARRRMGRHSLAWRNTVSKAA